MKLCFDILIDDVYEELPLELLDNYHNSLLLKLKDFLHLKEVCLNTKLNSLENYLRNDYVYGLTQEESQKIIEKTHCIQKELNKIYSFYRGNQEVYFPEMEGFLKAINQKLIENNLIHSELFYVDIDSDNKNTKNVFCKNATTENKLSMIQKILTENDFQSYILGMVIE